MKAKIPFSILFFAGAFLVLSLSAKASPQPEQNDNYKYDLNSGGMNLSIFKLFTIQPVKKDAPEKKVQKLTAPKPAEKKTTEPAYIERMRKLL